MKLLKNTLNGFLHLHWTFPVAFSYFIKGMARELNIAYPTILNWHQNIVIKNFKKRWQKTNEQGEIYFDINGAILPNFLSYDLAFHVFEDVFLVPCFYNDNYDSTIIDKLNKYMMEGPYGYRKDFFDVTISKDDVVIDAGAWIGDFSAYAASKGAKVYAFEPDAKLYDLLCYTQKLNIVDGEDRIIPVRKGLGSSECKMNLSIDTRSGAGNSLVIDCGTNETELVDVITLDKVVEENKLERIDFIKADIEGAERDLLKGATQVLKKFAPKLAICTYHLPDDPEVLEQIIMEANPNYRVIQLRHKLFACVETGE